LAADLDLKFVNDGIDHEDTAPVETVTPPRGHPIWVLT